MTTIISATELKNKVADVLNGVVFGGNTTVIERYGKPIAKIIPVGEVARGKTDVKRVLKDTFGSMPDFPDVTTFRLSRQRKITFSLQ